MVFPAFSRLGEKTGLTDLEKIGIFASTNRKMGLMIMGIINLEKLNIAK